MNTAPGIAIADDLCRDLFATFNRLKPHSECKKAWSWDGQIFAELRVGPVVKVRWSETLEEGVQLGWPDLC